MKHRPQKITVFFLVLMLMSLLAPVVSVAEQQQADNELTVGCSDWKPYCYYDNDKLQGHVYDIVKAIMDRSQLPYSFRSYPWNRILQKTRTEEDYLVIGLGRTQKREGHFSWLVPLRKPAQIFVYQLKKSTLKFEKPADLLQHIIAVERGAFTHDYLLSIGQENDKLVTVSRMDQLLKLILFERVEGIILDESVFETESIKNDIDTALFKKSMLLFEVTEYLAGHKNLAPEKAEKIKAAYNELLNSNKIQFPD